MVYVVIALIVIAIILGYMHSRKLKSDEKANETVCGNGCSSCPHSAECSKNEKK